MVLSEGDTGDAGCELDPNFSYPLHLSSINKYWILVVLSGTGYFGLVIEMLYFKYCSLPVSCFAKNR